MDSSTNVARTAEVALADVEAGLCKMLGTQLTLEDENTLRAILRNWREQGSAEPINVWRQMAAHLAAAGDTRSSEEWTATNRSFFETMGDTPGGEMFLTWVGGVWVRATHVSDPMFSKVEREMNRQVEALKVELTSLEPELARLKQEKKALTERKSALDSSIRTHRELLAETKKSIREVEGL